MTISNRAKVFTAGLLILIAIILILLFVRRPEPPLEVVEEKETFEVLVDETDGEKPVAEPQTEEERQADSALTVTGIFVERFGSYSSESNLANIEDVLPLATDNYRRELETLIDQIRAEGQSQSYYGVTTRVLSKKLIESDANDGTAVYEVLTQREESYGSVQKSEVRYQSIRVELKQDGDVWLVDGVTWL